MGFTPDHAKPVTLAEPKIIDCSFWKTGSGLLSDDVRQIGATPVGFTVSQAYGSLNVDTGVNVGEEFLFRSSESVSGGHSLRYRMARSQHIVNQHSWAMLADLVGDNLTFSVDPTGLLITVTLPSSHGFNATNIGQFLMVGGVVGSALSHPGRYAIVDVTGSTLTLSPVFYCSWTRSTTTATISFLGGAPIFSIAESATVSASSDVTAIVNGVVSLLTQSNTSNFATSTFTCLNAGAASGTLTLTMTAKAWTANATGTLTLYGWNYLATIRNGTSATSAWKDTQRKGWSSGASALSKTSDLAPLGVIDQLVGDCQLEQFSDMSPASVTTSLSVNARGTVTNALPDQHDKLYFFFSVSNGVVAPASTTRVSIEMFRLSEVGITKVQVAGTESVGSSMYQDVRVSTMPTTSGVAGAAAHDVAISGNPVRIGARGISANVTAVANGDTVDLMADLHGRTLVQLGNIPQLQDFNRVTSTVATETTLIAAVASVRHGIHKLTIANRDAAAHTYDIRDTTAGTIRETIIVPAGQTYTAVYPQGIWQSATNTNWTFQSRAAPTTAVEISTQSFRVGY